MTEQKKYSSPTSPQPPPDVQPSPLPQPEQLATMVSPLPTIKEAIIDEILNLIKTLQQFPADDSSIQAVGKLQGAILKLQLDPVEVGAVPTPPKSLKRRNHHD